MKFAVCAAAALVFAGNVPALAVSAQSEVAPGAQSVPAMIDRAVPAPPRENRRASAERVKAVDIPQWAKDEGHNGSATFEATIAADRSLKSLELVDSSNSEAIDAAVEARARSLYYFPATDAQGTPIESKVRVRMGYARYDSDSPGGGLADYTCGEFLREYAWFLEANRERRALFWLQNAYVSMPGVNALLEGQRPSIAQRQAVRDARFKQWKQLMKRCSKKPARLFLDEVEDRDGFLRIAEAF